MEVVTLDPSEVSTGRTELVLGSKPLWVGQEGIDWGTAQIEAAMAQMRRGEKPVDFRLPNRQVTIPLLIEASDTLTFNEVRGQIQKKVALLQQEGGWIKRELDDGGELYGDIVNASLTLGGGTSQAINDFDPDAILTLELIPDMYEAEVTLSDHTETSLPEITFVESSLRGDYPGRVRIVVDDDQGTDQATVLYGIRSRNYSNASTAKLAFHAQDLTALDAATKTTLSGSATTNVVKHTSLADDWTPVMGTNLAAGTYLTHVGTYRVFARLHSPDGDAVQARFVWDVGDLVTPTENDAWTFPGASQFYMADLGEIHLNQIPAGSHRWGGQIQAKGQGKTISVDRVWLFPTDEYFGIGQGSTSATGLSSFSARDAFDQSAGSLAGKTAAVGGTWAGAGDSDDFSVEATGHTAQRTAVSDANYYTGRIATVGSTTYSDVVAQVDVKFSALPTLGAGFFGLVLRYVDSSNFVVVALGPNGTVGSNVLHVIAVVAGTPAVYAQTLLSAVYGLTATWYTVKASVTKNGAYSVWCGFSDLDLPPALITGAASTLATGGALASGKAGIYDANIAAGATTRNYDNLLVGVPTTDAAIFASQSAELSTGAMLREDSAGAAYGPISAPLGDLPRLPAAGMDGRSSEIIVKASRGDLASLPDDGIDDISARLYYRPSWLYVPD